MKKNNFNILFDVSVISGILFCSFCHDTKRVLLFFHTFFGSSKKVLQRNLLRFRGNSVRHPPTGGGGRTTNKINANAFPLLR
jgi:hypothetical protein